MTRRVNDEGGASLILVVIFVMVFSVIMAAVLDLTGTALRTTSSYADLGDEQRVVDDAVEGAINAIRNSNTAGLQDGACDDYVYESITVTCTPVGDDDLNGGIDDLMPKYAILTLGTGECDGIELGGGDEMAVSGGIASNSRIAINERINAACDNVSGGGAQVHVFGDAYARNGWCSTDGLTATSELDCNAAGTEEKPPYLPAVPDISTLAADPAATCATPSGIVAFSPGLYTELPENHAERAGCTGSLWWFQPGTYYFDFPAADSEWEINPYNVVGGTPVGWSASSSPSSVPLKAACADPGIDETPPPGVQFILGGPSRISTQGSASSTTTGILELCAGADSVGNQRIALFALDDDQLDTRTVVTGNAQRRLATSVSATTGTWAPNADAGRDIDAGGQAVAAFAANGQRAAALGYSAFADVNAGSSVGNVYVEIRHAESGTTSKVDHSLVLKFDRGTGACPSTSPLVSGRCTATIALNSVPTNLGATTSVNVTSYLRPVFRYADVNSLTAELVVDASTLSSTPAQKLPTEPPCTNNPTHSQCVGANETATVTVDGIRLVVEHTTPGFRPQDSGSDPVLYTTSNPVAIFRGTFFAPGADLNINVHNAGETVFARGVVANRIVGNVSTSSQQDGSPFALPGLSLRRVVVFRAGVDGDGNGDIDDDEVRVRAHVAYDDSDSLFGRAVEVLHWVVVR